MFCNKSGNIGFKVLGQKSPCSGSGFLPTQNSGFLLTQKLISWQSHLSTPRNICCLDGLKKYKNKNNTAKKMAAYHADSTSTKDKNINFKWDKVIYTWKKEYTHKFQTWLSVLKFLILRQIFKCYTKQPIQIKTSSIHVTKQKQKATKYPSSI